MKVGKLRIRAVLRKQATNLLGEAARTPLTRQQQCGNPCHVLHTSMCCVFPRPSRAPSLDSLKWTMCLMSCCPLSVALTLTRLMIGRTAPRLSRPLLCLHVVPLHLGQALFIPFKLLMAAHIAHIANGVHQLSLSRPSILPTRFWSLQADDSVALPGCR